MLCKWSVFAACHHANHPSFRQVSGSSPVGSYLDIEKILQVAVDNKVDFLHPGTLMSAAPSACAMSELFPIHACLLRLRLSVRER